MTETSTPRATFRGFLFADLRGYSDYVEAHGDQAGVALLTAYRDVVRATIGRFDGAEIRTEGDSFYVIFPSASSAVGCGMEILAAAASAEPSIRVGIGVHAGEAADTGEGPVGSAVNIAARVCAQAAAGELLVTDTVRAVTRTTVPYRFVSRGPRTLKGISEPVTLYRVVDPAEADAASGQPAGGRLAVRSPWRVALAIGAALLGVVVVLLAIAALDGLRPTATPTAPAIGAGPTATLAIPASPAPSPSFGEATAPSQTVAPATATPGGSSSPSLTQAEQDLVSRLAGLTPDDRSTCRSGTSTERANGAIMSVTCPLASGSGADAVHYDLFDQTAVMSSAFDAYVRAHGDPSADCAKAPLGGGAWAVPQVSLGHVLCFPDAGSSHIIWVYEGGEGALIMGSAERADEDWRSLYAWWQEVHPLIAH